MDIKLKCVPKRTLLEFYAHNSYVNERLAVYPINMKTTNIKQRGYLETTACLSIMTGNVQLCMKKQAKYQYFAVSYKFREKSFFKRVCV